jgi:hypothetical protein
MWLQLLLILATTRTSNNNNHGRKIIEVQSFRCCDSALLFSRSRSQSHLQLFGQTKSSSPLRLLSRNRPGKQQRGRTQYLQHLLGTQKGGGGGGKDAILKQKLELLQPTRRKLQMRPGNYCNNNNVVANGDKENIPIGGRDANPKKVYDGRSVHQNRKPRGYWKSVANIDRELRDQWLEAIGATNNNSTSSDDLYSLLYPPPVPNEALLNHWNRHDLRNAIRSLGGRKTLAEALIEHSQTTIRNNKHQNQNRNECYIVPGKWKEMTGFHTTHPQQPHPLIFMVLKHDPLLHPERAPISRGQMKRLQSKRYDMSKEDIESWIQRTTTPSSSGDDDGSNTPLRKRADPGTWSRDTITDVLCDYLGWRKRTRGVPSVWMPRLCEFENSYDNNGDGDNGNVSASASIDERFGYLKNAITNTYGTTSTAVTNNDNNNNNGRISNFGRRLTPNSRSVDQLCYEMGLIPYREWRQFEGFHDLMVSLKEHIDNEHYLKDQDTEATAQSSSDYSVFPKGYSTTWRQSGYERLFYLVKNYGGKDLVAGRLGMATSLKQQQKQRQQKQRTTMDASRRSSGPFDLEFGISLMEYVKLDQLRKEPLRQHQNTNLLAQYQERDDDKMGSSMSNHRAKNNSNCICMPTRNQLLSKSPSSPASFPFFVGANANHQAGNGNGNGNGDGDAKSNTNASKNNENAETWGKYLDRKIIAYDGYENVARRLGLEWCEF